MSERIRIVDGLGLSRWAAEKYGAKLPDVEGALGRGILRWGFSFDIELTLADERRATLYLENVPAEYLIILSPDEGALRAAVTSAEEFFAAWFPDAAWSVTAHWGMLSELELRVCVTVPGRPAFGWLVLHFSETFYRDTPPEHFQAFVYQHIIAAFEASACPVAGPRIIAALQEGRL